MAKLKMGFSRLTTLAKIERFQTIIGLMTGNVNFTSPNPTLANCALAKDAARTAYDNSRDGGRLLTAILRQRMKEMMALVNQLAAYVENVAGGDALIILSSGFDVVQRGDAPPVGQVVGIRTQNGISLGSISVVWDKVPSAGAYVVEISETSAAGPFQFYRVALKASMDLTGLVPGKTYWIRIYAVGRFEDGLPSDISVHTASI